MAIRCQSYRHRLLYDSAVLKKKEFLSQEDQVENKCLLIEPNVNIKWVDTRGYIDLLFSQMCDRDDMFLADLMGSRGVGKKRKRKKTHEFIFSSFLAKLFNMP